MKMSLMTPRAPRTRSACRRARSPATRARRRWSSGSAISILRETTFWQDERAVLFGAHEVGEPIALRRPRHPRHGVEAHARRRDGLEARVLIEAAGQVADDRAVLGREQDDVELAVAAVAGHRGDQIARGRRFDRQHVAEARLLRVRREIAAVSRPAAPCRGTA